jgi:hypothetical protein
MGEPARRAGVAPKPVNRRVCASIQSRLKSWGSLSPT